MRFIATSDHELEPVTEDLLDPREDPTRQPPEPVQAPLIILRLLWDQRAFILRWAVRGLVIATVIAVLVPNRYTATTRLMPPENLGGSSIAMLSAMITKTASPGLGGLASDILGSKSSGALYMEALHSRTVEDRVVNRFDLRGVYWVRYMEDARKYLDDNTSISEDRKSGVITVMVTDRNRRRSAAMAQTYVEELNRLMNEVSTSSARRERIFIEQRLATVKQDLHRAAEDFSQFASQNTTLDISSQAKAMVEAGANLQGHLMAAQSELEGLETIYTANNVRVRSLRARVDELRHQLNEMAGGNPTAVQAANSAAVPGSPASGGLGSSNQISDMIYPSIRKLPLLGVRWAELYQQAKVQETVYQLLTQEYEMAKIQEAKEIPTIKVMDEAAIPERKSFPPRLGFMILGTVLAAITGASWVLGVVFWQAIETDDPAKSFTLDVLRVQKAWLLRKRLQLQGLFSKPPSAQHARPERGRSAED
jgi:capsule polysaccharide export protein KpsE/RkpR